MSEEEKKEAKLEIGQELREYIRLMIRDYLFDLDLDWMIDNLVDCEVINRDILTSKELELIGNMIRTEFRYLLR